VGKCRNGPLRRARLQEALVKLLVDQIYRWIVFGFALIMAAAQLGIDITAAIAGVGVAGLAVGFAAQDSLANVIAGLVIFWDKPFQVGDWITSKDHHGKVAEINMRTTRIRTRQNTYVIVPNKEIVSSVVINHSLYGDVRVDIPIGIAYKEDVREARRVILDAIGSTEVLHMFIANRPGEVRPGSSGQIVPGYEARIVDDDDRPVPVGEMGNLLIRGDSTCAFYWNQHDKTKRTIQGKVSGPGLVSMSAAAPLVAAVATSSEHSAQPHTE